jgi:pilus assembly protein TadC
MTSRIFKKLARQFPEIGVRLKQAEITDSPEKFMRKTFLTAVYMSVGLFIVLFMLLGKSDLKIWVLLSPPVLFILFFFYFLKLPDVIMLRKERELNQDIVFAARFLLIELESGVPLYDAFRHVKDNYERMGKPFSEIVRNVDYGTPMEEAIGIIVETTPSKNFRKMLWQILNSIITGTDLSISLKSVIDQIVREQSIELKEYGRKLNPLAMFYMMLAVILPSIGITLLVVFASFVSIQLTLGFFILLALGLAFLQFMFFSMIKQMRPSGIF